MNEALYVVPPVDGTDDLVGPVDVLATVVGARTDELGLTAPTPLKH